LVRFRLAETIDLVANGTTAVELTILAAPVPPSSKYPFGLIQNNQSALAPQICLVIISDLKEDRAVGVTIANKPKSLASVIGSVLNNSLFAADMTAV
jgi:hypothetical protein